MHPVIARRVLVAVCAAGIVGMIVTSIADSNGGALAFGLATAASAFGMILVTAVTTGGSALDADDLAADVEEHVAALLERGADEREIRSLVRAAVRLGRAQRPEG